MFGKLTSKTNIRKLGYSVIRDSDLILKMPDLINPYFYDVQ